MANIVVDCDAQTVSCLEMQQLLKLVSDIRSVIFIKNDLLQVEQLLQHAELLYTNFYATWLPGGTRCASLNPRAAMMIRLLSSSLRLDLARLRYHFQHRKAHDAPFSASNSHMLDIHMALRSSMDCALELLRGLVVEMRPENDILPLLEGVVPAGNWLIEVSSLRRVLHVPADPEGECSTSMSWMVITKPKWLP